MKVKRREAQLAGANSVSVRIEYSDGTIVENGFSTIKRRKKGISSDICKCSERIFAFI